MEQMEFETFGGLPWLRQRPSEAPGDRTYFTIFARWPDEIRLFSVEWEMIETEVEALAAVKQIENAAVVYLSDPDVPRSNVSEDIARLWLRELMARGINYELSELPKFILDNLSADEIDKYSW